ncbi:MBL fold metallo-hydrolase [Kribbella deserti]|uniref:MBL fold metallo-hydrolase n=1 Tax=Kribbella deserti TaxID=1926257 RepID=A0ABV6QI30_9ACTN
MDLGLGAVGFEVPEIAGFRAGQLLESPAAEGLKPDDVDTVFYTHLYHDHVGWTTDLAPAPTVPAGAMPAGLTFRRAHPAESLKTRHRLLAELDDPQRDPRGRPLQRHGVRPDPAPLAPGRPHTVIRRRPSQASSSRSPKKPATGLPGRRLPGRPVHLTAER